jgi:branched-chain amino acid aminotransferase
MTADEAFMTGTPFCLLPVTRLNSIIISDGKMGKITKLLLDTWSDNVGLDIIEQIKQYSNTHNTDSDAPSPYSHE